ncbi:hypothetical protein [Bythopirellula goksoeyrii]|uniref:Uncharacterized protein n=1 Tax=Bythopirellula goksoeyrii TaxID=1400387 RepID=A0A5B9QBS0_9BACT|nr:hypothetical protein [Bythopirellula goksoeyrii]QEG36497.1 hypothetical protein Pr1d_38110 [Bythopirellula goksoeyrii]
MDAYDADELISYRSLSSLAILALVLGLLSPLALMVPLFLVLPMMGIAVALLACVSIRSHAETLSGMNIAKLALFLSVFCLVAAPVKTLVRSQLFQRQADQAARQWLDTIVEGNISGALEQLSPRAIGGLAKPDAAPGNPSAPKSSKPAVQDFVETLSEDHFVEDLRAQAKVGAIEFKPVSMSVDSGRAQPTVSIDYSLDNKSGSSSVLVHCVRVNNPTLGESWKIEAWKQAADHVHLH